MLLTSTFTIPAYSLQHKWTLGRKNWIQATHCKQNSHYFPRGAKAVPGNKTQIKKFQFTWYSGQYEGIYLTSSCLCFVTSRTRITLLPSQDSLLFFGSGRAVNFSDLCNIHVELGNSVHSCRTMLSLGHGQSSSVKQKVLLAKQHQQIRKTQIWSLTHSWGTHLHRQKVKINVSGWTWSAERDFSILFKQQS